MEEIRAGLPELPDQKKARFMADLGLSAYDAGVLVAERETAAFFEAAAEGRDAKLAANWVTGELFGALNRSGLELAEAPVDAAKLGGLLDLIAEVTVDAARLGGLLDLVADGTISGRIAKEVFEAMWESGQSAADIVEQKGLKQISDEGAIAAIVDRLVADNPEQAEQFRAGNEKVIGWFVGQVMKATQGKANPGVVNQLLREKLG